MKILRSRLAMAACVLLLAMPPQGRALAAQDAARTPARAGWTVAIDPMAEPMAMMNREIASRNIPAFFDAISFDLTRAEGPNMPFAERQSLSDQWAQTLADMLAEQGFEAVPEAYLAARGMSGDQLRETMINGAPYGRRAELRAHMGRFVHGFVNDHAAGCSGDENAVIGFVTAYYPTENVRSDYGNVTVMLVGIGPCLSSAGGRGYVGRVKARIAEQFTAVAH